MPCNPVQMTTTTTQEKSKGNLGMMGGILPIDHSRIPMDTIAGITLAALAIPEVMGYTKIAGMPVVTGLYTILIPMVIYAFFGSSRHLVVGADSATAVIMEVLELVSTTQPPLSWFCIDAIAMDEIDFTASGTLLDTYRLLKDKDIRLVLAEVEDSVHRELERSELIGLIGQDALFETLSDVEAAYQATISDPQDQSE